MEQYADYSVVLGVIAIRIPFYNQMKSYEVADM